jgi:hypothetical protein
MVIPTYLLHEELMRMSPQRLLAALFVLACAVPFASAQVITNGEIDRGLRFRGTVTHDGEPYTQRYSYSTGAGIFYLNGDSRQLWYLDYLDRADRAEKFGYRMPIDPYFAPHDMEAPPPVVVYPSVRAGFGFGAWRRR